MFYQGFKVLYRPVGDPTKVITMHGSNKRSYFLSGLKPNTLYQAEVKAFNDQGNGPASLPVTVTTLDSGTYTLGARGPLFSDLTMNPENLYPLST